MRAVVLGGGLAGLCAAAALARGEVEVQLVESDRLHERPGTRAGAPHGRQLHNLLGRAQQHLEALFPGFLELLVAAGGVRARVASQTHVFELGVAMPERDVGLHIISAPHHVIEHTVHRSLPGSVTLDPGVTAKGLILSGHTVRGVRTSRGDVEADLVVDAMGARSPMTSWLPAAPDLEIVKAREWYCTLDFARPSAAVGVPDFWMTFPTAPRTRGALLSPAGPDRWRASVSGIAGDPVPTSASKFREYLASLEVDVIARTLSGAVPTGRPTTFQRPLATWRRYDNWSAPVDGLLPVGDAFASLSPLLGQGISVAAWHASLLTGQQGSNVAEFSRDYLRLAGNATAQAWQLSTIFRPANSQPADRRAVTLTAADWRRIAEVVQPDPAAHDRYVRVWHLLEPVSTLAAIAAVSIGQGAP